MKILLVQGYLGRREVPIFPLGLAYLASNLVNHDVKIFDPNVADDPYGELTKNIQEFSPDIIGMSLRNADTTQYRDPYNYFKNLRPAIALIKSIDQKAILVIGGPAFSIFADTIMERIPEIDFGVYLDGEESFPELLDHLDYPEKVKGIYYRKNGQVRFSGHRQPTDFIWTLKPMWDLFELKRYDGPESIGVLSKKGCSLKCIYCVYPLLTGAVMRLRPPESVVDEIEELVTKWGVEQFIFADSIFAIPKKHAEAICQEMIKRNLKVKWGAYFNEKFADREFLYLVKEAGCVFMEFSPDGFNDRSLQLLKKPFSQADVMQTYRLAQEFEDMQINFCFFTNPPGQTFSSFVTLMWLFFKTRFYRKQFKAVRISLNVPRLMPNTELYELALAEGSISRNTDLLPEAEQIPASLFYHNSQNKQIDQIFSLLLWIKSAIKKIAQALNSFGRFFPTGT